MKKIFILSFLVLFVASCGGRYQEPPSVIPSQSDSVFQSQSAPQAPNQMSGEENPLSNHDTYISFTDVSTSFPVGTLVMEGASVPEVLACPEDIDSTACEPNEILIYFIDAESLTSPGDEDIVLIRSTDGGQTWTDKETISLEGKTNIGPAVDPSVVMLEDGSVRLYYYGPDGPFDPFTKSDNSVYSAVSDDGVNFKVEDGIRLTHESLTDPDVTYWNNKWYMAYSTGQDSGLAVSDDSLNFEDLGAVSENAGGVPGIFADFENLRIYGCSMQGISSAYSSDGLTFTKDVEKVVDVQGGICDPSISYTESLGYVFVYKLISQ